MARVETRDFAPLFDGITMQVIGHDDIAIQAQRPRLDTVCQAIDDNITILVAGEHINPIYYCGCDEMRGILVSYFVSFTHDTNVGIYACIRQSEIASRVGRSRETTPIVLWLENYGHHGTTPIMLWLEHYGHHGTTPIIFVLEHYAHQGYMRVFGNRRLPPV